MSRHTMWAGPWHYCARCDDKTKISDMQWQRGKLLCPSCIDTALIGQREVAIARILSDGKHELEPDPKLKEAVLDMADDDIFQ